MRDRYRWAVGGAVLLALLLGMGRELVGGSRDSLAVQTQVDHEKGSASRTEAGRTGAGGFNLILVSLDTLRADRLGAYGYRYPTSPTFDALAKRGALFENAYSVSSWTLPSHMTIMTGVYPTAHGLVRGGDALHIGDGLRTVAEILQGEGYRTVAHTGGGNISGRWGFKRGFERYTEDERKHKGDLSRGFAQSVRRSLPLFHDLSTQPLFLFLHTYDIHCPYSPPEPYSSMFASEGAAPLDTDRCGAQFTKKGGFGPAHALQVSDRYDGGIRWVDESLRSLVESLDAKNLLDSTYLVVTSDHGEELFEHGRIGHRASLHRELLHVPLLIVGPGITPRRVSTAVSLVDLFPTMLQLVGAPVASQAGGRSLVPLMMGSGAADHRSVQWSELDRGARLRSRIGTQWHLIFNLETQRAQLFDLLKDQAELRDQAAEHPQLVAARVEELRRMFKMQRTFKPGTRPADTAEEQERLRSLGYL